MKEPFRKVAHTVSAAAGSPWAFGLALSSIIIWAILGPAFHFSDTWQLVINTSTTIITFLMVFLIQNTQNRDGRAMQLKLDELIRVTKARDSFIEIEDLSDDDLAIITREFERIHAEHPAVIKFHKRLADAHHKRKSAPSIADQVSNLLHTEILPGDKDKK